MKTIIYRPPSPGSDTSAEILEAAIMPAVRARGGSIKRIRISSRVARAEWLKHESAEEEVDCAFFMERILDHPAMMRARHRILVPNPEWLDSQVEGLTAQCTHMWHKSRFSLERLSRSFPHARHDYLGFTSRDPGQMVESHEDFVHLRGKLGTQRNTDSIFAAWASAPNWPDLHVHFYQAKEGGLNYPRWLHDGNVHVRMGWLDRSAYLDLARSHGIHLCTSEVEGFGHYINEARAMGALIVTVDGAPMNELVDDQSGILVPPSSHSAMSHGIRYSITAADLAPAVDRLLSFSPEKRRALGGEARQRFVAEDRAFRKRAQDLFAGLD